jgi:hypothetical protein
VNAHRILSFLGSVLLIAATPAPDDARNVYLGTWQGSGSMYATPYSKPGDDSDTTSCSWQAGTTYLVCAQHHVSPYGPGDQLSVYVRSGDGYVFTRIDPGGSAYATNVTVNGTTWTYGSNFQDGSLVVQIRTVNTFPSPGVENWYTEYSTDAGRHWKRMAQGTEHRISAPSP